MDPGVNTIMIPFSLFLLHKPASYPVAIIRLNNTAVIRVIVGMGQGCHCRFFALVEIHQPLKIHIENQVGVNGV